MPTHAFRVPLLAGSLLLGGCPGDDAPPPSETPTSTASSTGDITGDITGDTTDDFPTTGEPPDTTGAPPDTTTDAVPTTGEPNEDTTAGTPSCAASGSYAVPVTGITDPFSHLAFLLLWFNQAAMDSSGMEEVNVSIDGTNVSMSISARDMGSGSGHGGVAEVSGTIDESDCSFSISGEVPYSSDMGDFGMVTAEWTGVADAGAVVMTCSLSGGSIPSGPIDYMLDFAPE